MGHISKSTHLLSYFLILSLDIEICKSILFFWRFLTIREAKIDS